VRAVTSPSPETRAWRAVQLEGNVQGYQTPEGVLVPTIEGEPAEVRVVFTIPGLPPLELVPLERSLRAKGAVTRSRRAARELSRRGYS